MTMNVACKEIKEEYLFSENFAWLCFATVLHHLSETSFTFPYYKILFMNNELKE